MGVGNMNKRYIKLIFIALIVILTVFAVIKYSKKTIQTSSGDTLSNKKIGWGIKRNDNHEQPDLGSVNKKMIDENDDIAMGNSEKPYIYLSFDEGYEAGYTSKILDILKENDVKAAFFITGHYLNTQKELVKRMIDEGHIVGNQFPTMVMYHI